MNTRHKTCDSPECYNLIVEYVPGRASIRNFCSSYCAKYMMREVRTCPITDCSAKFTIKASSKQRYCSKSCSNRGRSSTPKDPTKLCKRCSLPIGRSRTYCDPCWSSKKKWQRQDKVDVWLSGDSSVVTGSDGELLGWAKEHLIEEAGTRCTRCGWAEPNVILKRPILTIDHIDGNWRNNSRSNLVVLCPNCHSVTPTYCSLNAGSVSGTRPQPEGNRLRKPDRVRKSPVSREPPKTCLDCSKEVNHKSVRCNEHNVLHRGTKIVWPDLEVLVDMVMNQSYSSVGRSLGVSDNAIRKHLKRNGYDVKTLEPTLDTGQPV